MNPGLFLFIPGWDRPRNRQKKKFSPEFRSFPTRATKFKKKKIAKKFKKFENIILALFLSKPGWHRSRKGKKKKKLSRFPFLPDPVKKIPKKKSKKIRKTKKTSFWDYFYPNWDEIGRGREKKILVPNFVPILPGLENSKKNSKKIHKHNSDFISIQTGLR